MPLLEQAKVEGRQNVSLVLDTDTVCYGPNPQSGADQFSSCGATAESGAKAWYHGAANVKRSITEHWHDGCHSGEFFAILDINVKYGMRNLTLFMNPYDVEKLRAANPEFNNFVFIERQKARPLAAA